VVDRFLKNLEDEINLEDQKPNASYFQNDPPPKEILRVVDWLLMREHNISNLSTTLSWNVLKVEILERNGTIIVDKCRNGSGRGLSVNVR